MIRRIGQPRADVKPVEVAEVVKPKRKPAKAKRKKAPAATAKVTTEAVVVSAGNDDQVTDNVG